MSVRLTPRLCRAARALTGLDQNELASLSGVSRSTIGAFEIKDETARMMGANNRALIETFERAGLQFIPEDESGGLGMRLCHQTIVTRRKGLPPAVPVAKTTD